MTTTSMDAALAGLRVAQRALDVASLNIANASTPGYTKKTAQQETLLIAGAAAGARSIALSRVVDRGLLTDLQRQSAVSGNYNVRLKYLDRVQAFHGASEVGQSLSAKVTDLSSMFSQLSLTPNDSVLLSRAVIQADSVARGINEFSNLITATRTDAEHEIVTSIANINKLTTAIAKMNADIVGASSAGRSTVDLEDQRDQAIKELSQYVDIVTFPSGKAIYVATRQGEALADTSGHALYFDTSNVLPSSYYPGGGLNGLRINSATGTDITQTNLGGKLGALFELRDATMPKYMAQLDEFAQKMAERFKNAGMKLFSDANGNVPASVADPGSTASYVGYSTLIQVNPAVAADPTLIRNGTTGNTEPTGSNEVIRRISQFVFGSYAYQQATGSTVIPVGPALIPATIPMTAANAVAGNVNLAGFVNMGAITALAPQLPGNFTLTINGAPQVINVLATDTAADVVNTINTAFGTGVSTLNSDGQLVLYAQSAITVATGTINAAGLNAMGLTPGVTAQPNPSFQVQVGTRAPVTITITGATTSATLLASLNAVPGLTASLSGGGGLVLTPTNGGDLKIIDGPASPLVALGMTTQNVAHTPLRQNNLGPGAPAGTLSTGLLANSTLTDYMSSIISAQAEDHSIVESASEQESSFLQSLETRNSNISGVNIDQEVADLVRIQSSYTAAAKMISATQRLFDELMNAFGV